MDRTALIARDIHAASINSRHVQVGTLNGRVILRGWVATADDKRQAGAIAIAASRVEVVDNQITVGQFVSGAPGSQGRL
jgi:osmotically-inducible protein OsmY